MGVLSVSLQLGNGGQERLVHRLTHSAIVVQVVWAACSSRNLPSVLSLADGVQHRAADINLPLPFKPESSQPYVMLQVTLKPQKAFLKSVIQEWVDAQEPEAEPEAEQQQEEGGEEAGEGEGEGAAAAGDEAAAEEPAEEKEAAAAEAAAEAKPEEGDAEQQQQQQEEQGEEQQEAKGEEASNAAEAQEQQQEEQEQQPAEPAAAEVQQEPADTAGSDDAKQVCVQRMVVYPQNLQ